MATERSYGGMNGRVRMRENTDRAGNHKKERASKVTSMIELFSTSERNENFATNGVKSPNAVRRNATVLENLNKQNQDSSWRDRKEWAAIIDGDSNIKPLVRRTSPLSLANRTPKPYARTKTDIKTVGEPSQQPASVEQPEKPSVSKNRPIVHKRLGQLQQSQGLSNGRNESNIKKSENFEKTAPMDTKRLVNGGLANKTGNLAQRSLSPNNDTSSQSMRNSDDKKIQGARVYWEHKIKPQTISLYKSESSLNVINPIPRLNSSTGDYSSGATKSSSPTPRAASSSEDISTSSVAERVKNFSHSPTSPPISPKHRNNRRNDFQSLSFRPKSEAAGSTVGSNSTDKNEKPVLPVRPRFVTSAGGVRPNQLPDKLQSSLHATPLLVPGGSPKAVRRPVSPLAVSPTPPVPTPRSTPQAYDVPPKKPAEFIPVKRNDGNNNKVVNPLPKPERTFTFSAADLTTSVKQKPKRPLARVSSDAPAVGAYDSLGGFRPPSHHKDLQQSNPNLATRAPKDGYEHIQLPAFKGARSQTVVPARVNQRWQRQHNYEEVEEASPAEDFKSNPTNYDRINLSSSMLSLEDKNDRYSHLTFKQDLHTSQGKPSPILQHMKLRKQNSDMSDTVSRSSEDMSRSEKTVESGLLQITDKIRDVFTQFGKKYKQHQKSPEEGDGDTKSTGSSGEDSDTETDFSKHKQTLDRVRTHQRKCRNTIKYKSMERELSRSDECTIFEQVLICKVVTDQEGKVSSKVSYRFPAPPPGKKVGDEKTLAHFCFPDIDAIEPCENMQSHSYSFMLTRENGSREFGYCRRILPPGTGPRYPVVYCLISPLGSFGLYELILDELERKHRTALKSVSVFLETIFVERFPAPGRSLVIKVEDPDGPYNFTLRRPFDTRLEHVDLQCLLSEMGVENTIKVFSSLLLERRVIISGKDLSTLTACIYAIRSLLYPFVWQHVFVPVLPPPMIDLCCSPTPLLVGILETSVEKLKGLPLEEVFILNLSTREVISSVGDELEILPRKLQSPLMNTLAGFASNGRGNTTQPSYDFAIDYESAERNTVISEAFMHLFVEMIGHYQHHLQNVSQPSRVEANRFGKIQRNFNKESFYEDVTSRSLRRFLDLFMGTQMFDGFIHSRELANPDYEGLFERRIAYHLRNADASQLNFTVIKSKMKKLVKGIGKKK